MRTHTHTHPSLSVDALQAHICRLYNKESPLPGAFNHFLNARRVHISSVREKGEGGGGHRPQGPPRSENALPTHLQKGSEDALKSTQSTHLFPQAGVWKFLTRLLQKRRRGTEDTIRKTGHYYKQHAVSLFNKCSIHYGLGEGDRGREREKIEPDHPGMQRYFKMEPAHQAV